MEEVPKPPKLPEFKPESEPKDKDKDKPKKKKSTDSKEIGSFALGRHKDKEPKEDFADKLKQDSLFGALPGEKKPEGLKPERQEGPQTYQEFTEAQLGGEATPEEIPEIQQYILEAHEAVDDSISGESQDPVEQAGNEDVSDWRRRALEVGPELATQEKLFEMDAEVPENLVVNESLSEEVGLDEPQDFDEQEIPVLNHQAESSIPKAPTNDAETEPVDPPVPVVASAGGPPRRPPRNPWLPRATPMSPGGGSGYYTVNAIAGGGRPGATFKPEYVPVRDESLLGILPGGIVGYLMGRRRGYHKAKEQAAKAEKRLEKRVKTLEQDITQKENYIRKVSRERARERLAKQSLLPVAEQAKPASRASQAEAPTKPVESRKPAPEAHQLHGKTSSPEKIGKVLIDAEAPFVAPQMTKRSIEQAKQPLSEKAEKSAATNVTERQVETMSRNELLSLSEKIIVDGSSLRQVYETRLVGEKGLRRLIQEYLGNGDIKKALRREIVEREVDFERDPILRDNAAQASLNAGGSATTLKELLKKADGTNLDDSEEVAFLKARAAFESREQTKQHKQRRVIDAAFATTIVILAIVVTTLILER